jgi:hypothetical protein
VASDLEQARRKDELASLILRELKRLGGSCDVEVLLRQVAAQSPIAQGVPRTHKPGTWAFEHEFHATMLVLMTLDEVRRVQTSKDHRADRYEIVAPPPGEEYDERAVEERRRELIYHPYPVTIPGCSCAHVWRRRHWFGSEIRYDCTECGRELRRYEYQLVCGDRGGEGELCAWPDCVTVLRSYSQREKDARRRRRWTSPPEPDEGD